MIAKRFLALTALSLLSTGCSLRSAAADTAATAAPTFNTTQLDAFVTRMMKDYHVPGVGLAVVENGKISYVKGYGVRDVATGAAVTPNTQFTIASVTKSFTALDMMVLVKDGRVDLDAPVTTYIPEFKLANPESTRTVTVRHLLSHSTGLVRTDASIFDLTLTARDIIAAAATTELVGKPGETFVYSNVNTIIAGEIIRRVSGQSWEAFTQEHVLRPLGMTTATLTADALRKQRDIAVPHELNVVSGGLQATDYFTLGADAPAGAVNANAAEMARYVQFQLGEGKPIITPELLREMHTGGVAAESFNLPGLVAAQARELAAKPDSVPASLVTDEHYGLYWGTEKFLGQTLVQHGGNATGMTSNVTLVPQRRSGVVILANAEGANFFMEAVRLHVAQVLLGQTGTDVNATLQAQLKVLGQDNVSIEADRLAARTYKPKSGEMDVWAGTYTSLADPESTRVTVDDGTLKLESGFQSVRFSVKLLPLGSDRFMATSQPLTGTVVKFVQKDGKRSVILESLLGALPIAEAGK